MGVNWDLRLLHWRDHTPNEEERYSLSHLHPFTQRIELAATDKHPARTVELQISFGLHTFTRSSKPHDKEYEIYRDNREIRTFCHERYQHSLRLPHIVRTLQRRRCEFARGVNGQTNYVTVETSDGKCYEARLPGAPTNGSSGPHNWHRGAGHSPNDPCHTTWHAGPHQAVR